MRPPAPPSPSRGEVWVVDLDPTRGHEQRGRRPVVVISHDDLNRGPAGLSIAVPVTTRERPVPFHVRIEPPLGGLSRPSFAKCEEVRALSHDRFARCLGALPAEVLAQIEDRLRILMDL